MNANAQDELTWIRRICAATHNHPAMQGLLIAICDPTRRAALALLWDGGEHCGRELMARLDAGQSRMSRHMKVLLLIGIVFVAGVLRSWFSPEKTRAILAGKNQIRGYPLASLLGVLTPFCSCSSVPLFIGFVSAGILSTNFHFNFLL